MKFEPHASPVSPAFMYVITTLIPHPSSLISHPSPLTPNPHPSPLTPYHSPLTPYPSPLTPNPLDCPPRTYKSLIITIIQVIIKKINDIYVGIMSSVGKIKGTLTEEFLLEKLKILFPDEGKHYITVHLFHPH